MNTVDKEKCCGCEACVQACPQKCITLNSDNQGFSYPCIDTKKCIDCKLCEKVCSVNYKLHSRVPVKVYAAYNKDLKIRLKSSSGGIFHALASKTISDGGIVYGAYLSEDLDVVHGSVVAIDELEKLLGSKYVQSKMGDTFVSVKRNLDCGVKVLFAGTPCQVSGLKLFLKKSYDNLQTIEIACHGVPSPKLWHEYLDSNFSQTVRKEITNVHFRDKKTGWRRYSFTIKDKADNNIATETFDKNTYMQLFLSNTCLRPSCYICKYKNGASGSNVTLGDFWGVWKNYSHLNDNKGVSIIYDYDNILKGTISGCDLIEISIEDSLLGNSALCQPTSKSDLYDTFWDIYSKEGWTKAVRVIKKIRPSFLVRLIRYVKRVIKR